MLMDDDRTTEKDGEQKIMLQEFLISSITCKRSPEMTHVHELGSGCARSV